MNYSLKSGLTNTNTALSTHKASGDHDGRYYTESEVDAKINTINNDINSGVNYLKWRGNSGNLNWSLMNGVWSYGTSTVDRPNDYGVCLVLNSGSDSYTGYDWFFQLAFGTNGHIYTRNSINATDGGKFSGWVMIK